MEKNKGWVSLHRQIQDSKLWLSEPFTKAQAWIDLVLFANHKDGVMFIRGNEVDIKRGQIGWSELTMMKRWRWSKNKVRRFLKWLETEQQIKQQKLFKITTIITILNYDKYQNDTTDDTTEGLQKDYRRYTNNNDNNVNNVNNSTKVEKAEPYGNEDINWLLTKFEEINGYPSNGRKVKDRQMANHLLRNFSKDQLTAMMKFCNGYEYAPNVGSIEKLWFKRGDIIAGIKKLQTKKPKIKSL